MEHASSRSSQDELPASANLDQAQLKKAITAAAIAAASSAAPGQRERVVADAVYEASAAAGTAQAQKDRSASPDISLGTAGVQDGVYQSPAWGASPPAEDMMHMSIDVLKVLQFQGRAVFLADMGSTHGSTLNGKQLEPFLFHRVAVGSQFRLGHSTRSYAFNAPQEWQLPEGPNRVERRRARAELVVLERAAAAAQRDQIVAEKTMQAALQGRLDWASEETDVGGTNTEVEWRVKSETGSLSEKQLKIAESIRSKEYKLQKTQEAANKIRRREGPDQDLTSGQAAALLNNEKAIDRLQNELDDLEETMQESLRDSQHGREAQLNAHQRRKRARHHTGSDSDGDDEFFDRTERQKPKPTAHAVLTVHSLLAKLQDLQAEEQNLLSQLEVAQAKISSMRDTSGGDSLDSIMSAVAAQGAEEDVAKVEHLIRLTRDQIAQQRELLDIADPHQEQRSSMTHRS